MIKIKNLKIQDFITDKNSLLLYLFRSGNQELEFLAIH